LLSLLYGGCTDAPRRRSWPPEPNADSASQACEGLQGRPLKTKKAGAANSETGKEKRRRAEGAAFSRPSDFPPTFCRGLEGSALMPAPLLDGMLPLGP